MSEIPIKQLPRIIGLCGRKNTGKNTVADILSKDFGYVQLSFAEPLRVACKAIFGLSYEEMSDRALKETPLLRWPYLSPRKILQLTGTELFRNHFPGVWIERLKAVAQRNDWVKFVVTDVRFIDEADAIQELGGKIIRVIRPGFEQSDGHLSETELSQIPPAATVINAGDIEALKDSVYIALNHVVASEKH